MAGEIEKWNSSTIYDTVQNIPYNQSLFIRKKGKKYWIDNLSWLLGPMEDFPEKGRFRLMLKVEWECQCQEEGEGNSSIAGSTAALMFQRAGTKFIFVLQCLAHNLAQHSSHEIFVYSISAPDWVLLPPYICLYSNRNIPQRDALSYFHSAYSKANDCWGKIIWHPDTDRPCTEVSRNQNMENVLQ